MSVFIIVLILFIIFFTEELYRYIFCRNSSKLFTLLFDKKGHKPDYYITRDKKAEIFKKAEHEIFTIENDRHQKLKGFYYPCGSGGRKIAFIVHGYRSEHIETGAFYYDYYKSRNIDIFTCDNTAAGESEGHFIGFDIFESTDCLKWIDFLIEKFGENTQIILHGFSMGGATVLQMSSRCPSNVRFIIADSAYINAKASMKHQIGPCYLPMRFLNKLIAGYDWNDSDVTESLSHSELPVLFVQGQDDRLVPSWCGPRLYELYKGEKDCLFQKDTRHIETMYTSPEKYCKKIDTFLNRYTE